MKIYYIHTLARNNSFILLTEFYSTFRNYLNFCADLAKRRGAMSGLWHGVPQEVRNTLPGVQYLRRGKSSDLGAGGG